MNSKRFLETEYHWQNTQPRIGGNGSAQVLPMSEDEMQAAEVRRIPIGFTSEPKPKPRRRAAKPKKGAGS